MSAMKCAGCSCELQVGDRYIEDSASGFIQSRGGEAGNELDGLIAEILGGKGDKLLYCEDCTEPGGDYLFETVYGDEGRSPSGKGRGE